MLNYSFKQMDDGKHCCVMLIVVSMLTILQDRKWIQLLWLEMCYEPELQLILSSVLNIFSFSLLISF